MAQTNVMTLAACVPCAQGARLLYLRYMRPVLQRYQPKVDRVMQRLHEVAATLYRANMVGTHLVSRCVRPAHAALCTCMPMSLLPQPRRTLHTAGHVTVGHLIVPF